MDAQRQLVLKNLRLIVICQVIKSGANWDSNFQ